MSLHFMFNTLKLMFAQDKNSIILERNREIITRLKFISTFQPGEKINTSLLHIESNSIFTPIKRMINGESRSSTLQFISNTIDRSFEIINTLSFSDQLSDKMLCTTIISDMINTIQGLKNIQKTYHSDKLFGCTIDTIIDNIHAKCMELKLKKPDLFPPEYNPKYNSTSYQHISNDIQIDHIQLNNNQLENNTENNIDNNTQSNTIIEQLNDDINKLQVSNTSNHNLKTNIKNKK